jgi:hypothetical protein
VAPQDVNLTVNYSTSDGTAVAGTDYVDVPAASVTIPAGTTSVNVTLYAIGDTVQEGDEYFTVDFDLLQPNASVASSAVTNVTVLDDDVSPWAWQSRRADADRAGQVGRQAEPARAGTGRAFLRGGEPARLPLAG